jgi:IS5 family transposase
MRRFAGIELTSDRIPDQTTILAFRNLLEKHELGEQIYCFSSRRLRLRRRLRQ